MTHVEARRTMSGLEFFRKMLAGEMPPPQMLDLLGIRLAEVEAGRVVFTATCEERYYNGTGVAHGGFAATLLDTALGCAINSAMPAGRRFTTLELKVNLTRPITKEAGLLRCEANVVHVYRVSPEDAPLIMEEHAGAKREKLAGRALMSFGAFPLASFGGAALARNTVSP